MSETVTTEVLVIGGGPGGYAAAFRAADLGKEVTLVEREDRLGGVCLNVGCIPSKTLLHAAEVMDEAAGLADYGVSYAPPDVDIAQMANKKEKIISTLAKGVAHVAKQKKLRVITGGTGSFIDDHTIKVEQEGEEIIISFTSAVLAAGSRPVMLPFLPADHPKVWTSTTALSLPEVPDRLAVIGGGIIGMEMAGVYHALGSKITVIEMTDQLIPGADSDLVRPLMKKVKKQYEGVYLSTKVTAFEETEGALRLKLEGGKKVPDEVDADAVLVSVGRRANGDLLNLEAAGLEADSRGVITVDEFQRTSVGHIYAVGDLAGEPMLAHRASYQGKIAAEHLAGLPSSYDPMTVPSVAYTSPEIAWMGLTEKQAADDGIAYQKGAVPWQASGRALSAGAQQGMTKVLFDEKTSRIIGAGIAGRNAGELLAETVLALEMGADAEDIARTMHAHPTLSETFMEAAEQISSRKKG